MKMFWVVLFTYQFAITGYPQNFWQQTNGPLGGDIIAITCSPNNEIFAGTYWDGLYRSTDDGTSWFPTNPTGIYNNVFSLGLNRNGHIYTGVRYVSAGFTMADIFRSTNYGNTWNALGLDFTLTISIAFNSVDNVLAGTDGDGIFRSTDNGSSWNQINTGLTNLTVAALAVTPTDNIFAGTSSGIFRSTNNGSSWTQINSGLTFLDVKTIEVSANGNVFCGTFGGGVFRSTNNGKSWTQTNSGLTSLNIKTISISSEGLIYAGSWGDGIFRSSDNGNNWTQINFGLTHGFINAISINANEKIFSGNSGGGIFSSTDNGNNWLNVGLLVTHNPYLSINSEGDIFAAHSVGISRSTDNGESWTLTNTGLEFLSTNSIIFSSNGDVFAGTGGVYNPGGVFRSTNNGDNWILCGLESIPVLSLIINRNGELLAGTRSNGIYFSTDSGNNWQQILSGDFNSVFSFTMNSTGDIFAATDNYVYRSSNNGRNWIIINGFPLNTRILAINSNDVIFAGCYSEISRSIDNGNTSTKVLDANGFEINSIVINSSDDIFAGSMGVYFSENNGDDWSQVNGGLPINVMLQMEMEFPKFI